VSISTSGKSISGSGTGIAVSFTVFLDFDPGVLISEDPLKETATISTKFSEILTFLTTYPPEK